MLAPAGPPCNGPFHRSPESQSVLTDPVRTGRDLRARGLVTLGILIALRAKDELKLRFPIVRANGCTLEELDEGI